MSKNSIAIKKVSSCENDYSHVAEYNYFKQLTHKIANNPVAHYLPQHYVGYTDLSIKNNAMITTGLGPCIGLGIYNPATNKAALAHIDDSTDASSVMKMVNKMSINATKGLEIFINGGNKISHSYLSPIVKYLQNIESAKIVFNDTFPIGKGEPECQSLGIDASGKFYTNKEDVFYEWIHPFKSPEIYNILNIANINSEYPLVEVDFTAKDHVPIIGLSDYHPTYYSIFSPDQ